MSKFYNNKKLISKNKSNENQISSTKDNIVHNLWLLFYKYLDNANFRKQYWNFRNKYKFQKYLSSY